MHLCVRLISGTECFDVHCHQVGRSAGSIPTLWVGFAHGAAFEELLFWRFTVRRFTLQLRVNLEYGTSMLIGSSHKRDLLVAGDGVRVVSHEC